jgi:superfamily II DNA or RNA helicase
VTAERQPLRPYQAIAIDSARQAYRVGKRSILLVAPTGAGKTRVGVELVTSALSKPGGCVLWLAHRAELLRQAYGALKREGVPAEQIGIVAPWASFSRDARVQVASIHTLVSMRRRGAELPKARVVVFDEAHHFAADEWREIAGLACDNGAASLGLTATPERGDGRAMGDLFDHLIPVASIRQLQAMGVLVPVLTISPPYRTNNLASEPVEAYQRHAPGSKAIVYCTTVGHAESVEASFKGAGIEAATIHAQTPPALRYGLVESYRTGSSAALRALGPHRLPPRVLCNVYTLTEGLDVPDIGCVILARGAGHPGMYLQMVGRGLRAALGKDRLVLIDLCGIAHEHGLPETDRDYSLDGVAITERSRGTKKHVKECKACGCIFERWKVTSDGKRQCPECGEIGLEIPPIKVVKAEMGAIGRAASENDRIATYRGLVATAAARGYKEGWIAHRFKALYECWPSRSIKAKAESSLGVQPWGVLPKRPPSASPVGGE